MRFRLVVDGEPREIEVDRTRQGYSVRVDGSEYRATARPRADEVAVRIGPRSYRIRFEGHEARVDDGRHEVLISEIFDEQALVDSPTAAGKEAPIEIRSPMPGRVVRVLIGAGDPVRRGQTLLILEAMKMQNEIPAPRDGVVREVRVHEGESITVDRVVVVVDAA
ncbi:MAG TPA: biotin/lipoyl-containing protein [Thermoplasmata archaeon]|nr:biotin/lipoyl-containing protein [Thermoplasmata archaeon]